MNKWLDRYESGGLVSKNSLNRNVTCSNCGWSWKLSDGGLDPMTCHKCGGDIKMKEGGELDEYQDRGQVQKQVIPNNPYFVTATDSNTGSFQGDINTTTPINNSNVKNIIPQKSNNIFETISQNYIEPITHFALRNTTGYRYMPGNLSQKDTTIDLTNAPMTFAKVNQIAKGNTIIGGEYIENSNNSVRKAKDWMNVKSDDTYSDKKYPSNKIQSFYGVENGKFKVGKATDFNPDTEIVPRRFGQTNINKAVLNNNSGMRLLDKNNNPIYQNSNDSGKFILYSPSTKKAQFSYISNGAKGVNIVNNFIKNNKDAQFIQLDNGRYDAYTTNPSGLTEKDFNQYYEQDWKREGTPGYNLIIQKNGGLVQYLDRGEYRGQVPTSDVMQNRVPIGMQQIPTDPFTGQPLTREQISRFTPSFNTQQPVISQGTWKGNRTTKDNSFDPYSRIIEQDPQSEANVGKRMRKDFITKKVPAGVTAAAAIMAAPLAAPIVSSAMSAPLTIGSTILPYVTPATLIGAGFGLTGANNLANDLQSGYYLNPKISKSEKIFTGLTTGLDMLGTPGAVEAIGSHLIAPAYKGALGAGKYLTEETALKNAYKINPWAFKPNSKAYYRMIGKEGYADALESGIVRPPQTTRIFDQSSQQFMDIPIAAYDDAYYNSQFPLDRRWYPNSIKKTNPNKAAIAKKSGYQGPYMAEVTGDSQLFEKGENVAAYTGPNSSQTVTYSKEHIPITNPNLKFYKEHWLKGYKEVSKPPVDFSKYLTQEEAVAARAERMLSQENKWVDQPSTLKGKFKTAVENHNPASDYPSPEKLGNNTGSSTQISKLANLSNANKARVAAHETGHYYRPTKEEGDVWNSFFDWSKIKGKTAESTPRDIRKAKEYLSGKGYFKRNSSQYGDEIRERAAQLKDYIAQKNRIPASKNFEVTTEQLNDAILNYTKDTGLDNNMSQMLGALTDKKGFLKAMNKYALGVIPAAIGAGAALQQQKNGGPIVTSRGQWLDKYQDRGEVLTPAQQVALANSLAKNPKRITTPAPIVPAIRQGYAPTPYSEALRNQRNNEYARHKAMQNSDLAKTFASFTPGGDNVDAGVIGAETFANLNPVLSGPILSASRLAPAIMHPTNNAYWGADRSIGENALGVLGAAGDIAMLSPYFKGTLPKIPRGLPRVLSEGQPYEGAPHIYEDMVPINGRYQPRTVITDAGVKNEILGLEATPIIPLNQIEYPVTSNKFLYGPHNSFGKMEQGVVTDTYRGMPPGSTNTYTSTLPQHIENTSLANTEKNLKDLEFAQNFAKQYGYDLPSNFERIAQSNELTNRTIRGLMDRHNTFVRGVSTNWEEIGKRNPEILRHLEGKGFNLSTKEGTKAAAEYMSTHIPINTGYGRASLNTTVFERGLDGLYTSNSIPTAEGYTYGQGYITKAKRPTNFSSTNRQDWINENNPTYYDETLPENINSSGLDEVYQNTANNIKEDKPFIINGIQVKKEGDSFFYRGLHNSKWDKIDAEDYNNFKNMAIDFINENKKQKLLRTERSKLPTDPFDFLIKKEGSANKMTEWLKTQPYQKKMREYIALQKPRVSHPLEQQKFIKDKIDILKKETNEMYNQSIQDYMKINHPDYNPVNKYAHYIHLGTPGEKVLQPIKSWEITPELWKNKSRSHTNSYTNKLSGMSKGGPIVTNRGQWDYPGQTTIIPSNNITMTGVDYPVLGVDNTGHTKMMHPGMDYTFPGQYVTEYPMMEPGGQTFNMYNYMGNLDKYPLQSSNVAKPIYNIGSKQQPVIDNTRVVEPIINYWNDPQHIKGRDYTQNQFNKAKHFHTKWMNSPMYKEMLETSDPVNAKNITKGRLNNLNNTHFQYELIQPINRPHDGAFSNSITGNVTILPKGVNDDIAGAGTHEFSHSIDIANGKNKKRLIPENDIKKINNYSNYWSMISDINNASRSDNDIAYNEYVADPTETRARLSDIRQKAYQNKLYDPFTQKVTPKILKKLTDFKFEEKKGWDPLLQLQKVYTNNEIMDLLNSVSKNNTDNNSNIPYAAFGGQMMKGGGSKNPTKYVNNPNSHSLKMYNDSLYNYNNAARIKNDYVKGWNNLQVTPTMSQDDLESNAQKIFNNISRMNKGVATGAIYSDNDLPNANPYFINDRYGRSRSIEYIAPDFTFVEPVQPIEFKKVSPSMQSLHPQKYNPMPEWEQRLYNGSKLRLNNDDGSYSSHKMMNWEADGKYYAAPTIVNKNGKLIELSPDDAINYHREHNSAKEFNSDAEAMIYADNGYKALVNVEKPKSYYLPIQPITLPQQHGKPVYGPGSTIIGYSGNDGKFSPAYQYNGAPNNQFNLQDKELLNNPELLKQYIQNSSYHYKTGGEMIKRADGSYSKRGLWDNIRDNRGSGKAPTKQMLDQERKIRNQYQVGGQIPTVQGNFKKQNEYGYMVTDEEALAKEAQRLNSKRVLTEGGSLIIFDDNWNIIAADDNPSAPYKQGGSVTLNTGGEQHRIYVKSTNRGEGDKGHIMVNHPTMDKGMWDTIDLTQKAGAKTIAQGVAATKEWHRENPYMKQRGGERNNNLKNINLNLPVIRHQEMNPLHFNGFLANDRNQNLFIGGINPRYQNEDFSVGPYMIGVGNKYFQKFPADMGMSGTYHVNDNFDINMGAGQNNINAGIKYNFANGGYVVRRSHDRKGKTHVVTGPDGTKKYFGDPNMGERGKSKYGKEAFYARHKSNLAKNPYFRAYARATWEEGGEIMVIGGQTMMNPVTRKDNRNWLEFLKN